jgi:peptide chain release factor 1
VNSVILEIRAGTGGDEAGLFASELLRMYQKFAQSQGWKFTLIDTTSGGIGNIKQATAEIVAPTGDDIFKLLKNESGVHRVQRVPQTEKSGRIHTSTVTIAILPKKSATELQINPQNLKIETFRSSGPGGQHMQKSDSAVRITHLPTGLTASCQSDRVQQRNKEKAMEILRARLSNMLQRQQKSKVDELRREQIGTARREEKIRTYNFPQNRVTDHRLGKSWHNLKNILDGDLEPNLKSLT